jgi:molybdopterin-containing oxidoreductase family iron-sulfur binding subunit
MSHDTDPHPLDMTGAADDESLPSRRRFLKGLATTVGVVAASTIPGILTAGTQLAGAETAQGRGTEEAEGVSERLAAEDGPINYPGQPVYYAETAGDEKFAMVIDVSKCIGCRKCVYACVKENNIGRDSGFAYIQVLEMERGAVTLEGSSTDYSEGGDPDHWYMPVQCMHCAKPTCVRGCPVKATWKEPDGIVVIDYKKCISCKNCIVTCPYEARHNNWVEPHVPEKDINPKVPFHDKAGVVEKCTFCVHRTRNGQTTACVEACPVGARTFGDLNDPDSAVSVLIRTKRVFRLKEELGNEPMIWYVG